MKKLCCFILSSLLCYFGFSFELDNSIWIVEKKLEIEGIIEGPIQNIIGEKVYFSDSKIIFMNQENTIKKEIIEFLTEEDLYNETKGSQSKGLSFSDFEFDGQMLKEIFYKARGPNFILGQECFLLSDDIMVSTYKGCYYQLKKQVIEK